MLGGFGDGVGTFLGEDTFDGQPIVVRFLWTGISTDDLPLGAGVLDRRRRTWEVNWVMENTRLE